MSQPEPTAEQLRDVYADLVTLFTSRRDAQWDPFQRGKYTRLLNAAEKNRARFAGIVERANARKAE